MFELLIVIGIIVAIGAIFGRKNIRRLFSSGRAQAGKLSRAAENADPVAMYQQQIDEATDQLVEARNGVANLKGLIFRIQKQVDDGEKEVGDWEHKAQFLLSKGEDERAKDAFSALKRAQAHLDENKSQLEGHKANFDKHMKLMQEAQRKIKNAQERSRELKSRLDLSKAEKQATELLNGLGIGGVGNSLDSLASAEEAINAKIAENRGATAVSNELNADALKEAELDEQIRQSKVDDEFEQWKASQASKV